MFYNKVLFVTFTVWFLAQALKVVIGFFIEKRFNFRWFIGTGGMPSSHAAGATALAVSTGLALGFNTVEFALATVFAMVTMFDAQGVRRSTGQQAAILNQIMDDVYWNKKIENRQLIELIGHTPLQVVIGCVLGIGMALILYKIF